LQEGLSWACKIAQDLVDEGYPAKVVVRMFTRLNHSKELWTHIDAMGIPFVREYWKQSPPFFYSVADEEKVECIEYLLKSNRFFSALEVASLKPKLIPSELIVKIMKLAVTKDVEERIDNRIKHSVDV